MNRPGVVTHSSTEWGVQLRWWFAPAARRAATLAVLALLAALATRRGELAALAAAPLTLLACSPRRGPPPSLVAAASTDPSRAVEGQDLTLTVRLALDAPVETLTVRLRPALPVAAAPSPRVWRAEHAAELCVEYRLRPVRWVRRTCGPCL